MKVAFIMFLYLLQRSFTRHYYRSTNALVFVIDSSDRETIVESKDELWRLLREEELNKDVAILIMANKQDLPNAMSVAEIAEILEVQEIKHRKIRKQTLTLWGGGKRVVIFITLLDVNVLNLFRIGLFSLYYIVYNSFLLSKP